MILKKHFITSFEDKKLDKQFRDQYFSDSIKSLRYAFFLLIFLYSSFGFLDVWMAPVDYFKFWAIRLTVSLLMMIVIFLSFQQSFKKYWQIAISICYVIGGLGIVLMLKELPTAYTYNSGLMLVFMSGYLFIKLRFIYAFISSMVVFTTYNFVVGLSIQDPHLILINNNFFYLGANIVGCFISYNLEQYQRKMFLNGCNLAKQRKDLERNNQLLEFKVKRRTESLLQKNNELATIIKSSEVEALKPHNAHLYKEEILNNIKSDYLSTIGHDIRTPLNAISGFSALLMDPNIEDESRIKYVDFLSKGISQMVALAKEIQIVGQLNTSSLNIQQETISLHHFLVEIKTTLQTQSADLLDFTIEEPPFKVLSIYQDKAKIQFILEQLIKKIILDFQVKKITISYQLVESQFEFIIQYPSSKGKGILNFQTLTATDILLAQIKGVLTHHQLNDFFMNTIFSIPYKEGKISIHELAPEILSIADNKNVVSNFKHTILIAEDNDLNFNFFNIVLGSSYIIHRAINGIEAINLFIKLNPDLILMDIKMPVMGGIEATKRIKYLSLKTPIIALTAFDIQNADATAFSDYIVKPISAEELLSKVRIQLAPLD